MTSRPRALRTVLGAVAGLLVLAACGTTEPPAAPAPAAPAPTTAAGPVSLTDSRGKQINLPSPAQRVVALEWNVAEHAVSLGVMPVGVADVTGYGNWVKAEPLDASVADVGVRGEPSIDSIAALRPDLILATDELPDTAVTQMEAFAPVAFVKGNDAKDSIGTMRRNLELVAQATGKGAEASALLSGFDASLADAKTKLAANAGQSFVFTDAYVEGSQVSIRPYAKGSLISDVTEQLGLTNAWTEPGDDVYGLGETDVEGLTAVGGTDHFLYIANAADGGDPFTDQLAANAVWKSLPVVQQGRVERMPDGIWMFGGPTSMEQYVDALVTTLGA
ncbi:iron-siderophore ABC transporter substrate-binding protein [Pseudonocardia charpentierae]|uniref:Iron-siderophore ABC transporter substrate-binding protein n=1 Tax=Pseudonocardia charpentierae TaxID=3075545 RepID=A0ABU2NAJ4_9PSEU|nr:iron-siderophore ABC transporter substrate-binding protein [Pseudonocardia sp. DSM 45834]MDT0350503.1 iron-siderophore ABC transporter substrate-binding protein [Pseudonocardia sp. DSM 45834]